MTNPGSTALVAAYTTPGRFVIERRNLGGLKSGEVRLAVQACGVCGSDLHAYDARWTKFGEVPGHETAGVVIECAADVTDVKVGDRIAIHPLIPCGACTFCRAGRDNVCSNMRDARGGYSTQMILPPGTRKYELPDSVDLAVGAMLEPLAVAVRAVNLAPLESMDAPCVVTGLGPIGQCAVRVLRARGYTEVIAVDVVAGKLDYARKVGAETLDPRQLNIADVLTTKFGGGTHKGYAYANVPVVIDCSGAPRVIADAVRSYLMPGGTLVVAALFEHDLELDLNPLVRKEITLKGSYSANSDAIQQAYALITSGDVELDDLVSAIVPLQEIDDVFSDPARRAGTVKIVIGTGGTT